MRKNNLSRDMANQKQRFSIRKLNVGAASVLLGTAFLFGAGNTVQAASDESSQHTVSNTNTGDQNQSDNESTVESQSGHSETSGSNEAIVSLENAGQTPADAGPTSGATTIDNSTLSNQDNDKTKEQKQEPITFYGQPNDRSKNPAGFNSDGIDPSTGKKYPVQLSDLEHDFIFKRTIVMHNGDTTSTFVEGLDGKAYKSDTDKKSGMYYRNATIDTDGKITYSEWKRLGNGGIYEFASDLNFPEYKLNTEMQDKDGNIVDAVPAASALEAENTTVNLYFSKVKIDVSYKDPNSKTVTNLVSDPFKQLSDNTYQYEGSSADLIKDPSKIADNLLTLTSTSTGVYPQFGGLLIDGTNYYTNQASAKTALISALSDYKNHNIQISVNYKYQLTINLYDETSGKLITVPATNPNAQWFKNENDHSVYSYPVTPNGYVVDMTKMYNYTMTDASLKTWEANFEKHSNGYWYTKSDMNKPLTLTLNYRSNGTYSFIGTMRDTDGNVLPADYTKSLGNMYKDGAYQYAQIKPGAYINDLTKFKLGDGYEYDYYLTADSLALWKEYFEQHNIPMVTGMLKVISITILICN